MTASAQYFLFALGRYDFVRQSVGDYGAILIATEDPIYVGRLVVGSDAVDNCSDLAGSGPIADRLKADLCQIAGSPGAEVIRQSHPELFTLMDDPLIKNRVDRVAFVRSGCTASFVRRPCCYEQYLRDYISVLNRRFR